MEKFIKKTWDYIKNLDAGSWKDIKYKREKVLLLQDDFDLCKGKCMINIDPKDAKAVDEMVKSITEFKIKGKIVITGKIPECALLIRKS